MKITIDTKEDSKDEIKKVISLLQNMLDEPISNIPEDIKPGILNIFNNKTENIEELKKEDIKTEDLLKETNIIEEKEEEEEEKKTNLKIEPY